MTHATRRSRGSAAPSRRGRILCALALTTIAAGIAATGAAAATVISGADGDLWNTAPVYVVTFDRGSIFWSASNGEAGFATESPVVIATRRTFAEGPGSLTVIDSENRRSPRVARSFVIDRTPPAALTVAGPASATTAAVVTYTWTGAEAGARFTWRLDGPAALAPADTTLPQVAFGPLGAGAYTFTVRQTDAAGNAGPESALALAVAPPPVRAAGVLVKLPSRNPSRLIPRRAARVKSVRPVLRWTRGPAGTTLYNVQIYRIAKRSAALGGGVTLRKVGSAFPHHRALRTARLTRGACYVWRVWPNLGGTFTPRPLGISHFCVKRG